MKKIIYVLVSLFIIIAGCKKEDSSIHNKNTNLQFKSVDDVMEYAQNELDRLSQAMVGLIENQNFISVLHSKVDEMFDGDYNVLFTDLIEACDQANINLVYEMKLYYHSIGGDSSLIDPLGVFQDINGYNYYPQIYIPEFEDNNWDPENLPIVCPYNGDDVDVIEGYSKDGLGAIRQIFNIEEDDATLWQIWIISINEDVDNNGYIDEITDINTGATILSNDEPSLDGDGITINAAIDKIRIKDRKESWPGGKSEIAIRLLAAYTSIYDIKPGLGYGTLSDETYRGKKIYKVKKKDIKDGNWITEQVKIATNWEADSYYSKRVHIAFAIFERDWYSGTKLSPDIPVESNTYALRFRSRDDAYAALHLTSMEGYNDRYVDGWGDGNSIIEILFKKVN